MKKSVQERREKVSEYLRKNIPEILIAKNLGFSRQTIVRDVAFLKESSRNWLDGLAKDGFIFEYQQTLEKVKNNGARLEALYEQAENPMQRLAILIGMDRNAKLYLELLGETPTIHAFRKAVRMNTIRNV